ncbi:unnamed protein product [Larinioides sclopetarius]|uniref:Uncharacterized protein n=1 Tax=Larinioides sclopetarius TaxID=280406 RepID=A0AAV2A5K4_9ARAC
MYVCLYVAFVQRRRKHKIGKSEQMKRQISSFIDLKKKVLNSSFYTKNGDLLVGGFGVASSQIHSSISFEIPP